MSAVKTLVSAPAGAPDTLRNARGALAIPTPQTTVPAATRGCVAESSFYTLLSKVARKATDRPDRMSDTARKTSPKARERDSDATEAADRADRSDRDKVAGSSPDADDDRKVERNENQAREDQSSEDTASAADDARNEEPGEAAASDDRRDSQNSQDSQHSSGTTDGAAEPRGDGDGRGPGESKQNGDKSTKPANNPADELLRQLGQLANRGVQAQSAPAVTTATPSVAEAGADTKAQAQVQAAQPVAPKLAQTQANERAVQAVGDTQNVPCSRGSRQGGAGAPTLESLSAPAAAGPGPTTLAGQSASQTDQLARLVAAAAGLADAGSLDSGASQPGTRLDPTQRIAGRQADQPGADGAQARAGFIAAMPRAASVTTGARAESFTSLLAQSNSASDPSTSLERAAELVRANVGMKNSSITIRLDPPELGRIQLDARLRDDVLSIHVQADTAVARDLLQSRMDDLRRALDRHGITIDRFEIEPRPASPSANGHGAQDRGQSGQQQQQQQQQQSADGGLAQQWQQRDASSGPARGDGDGAAAMRDAGASDDSGAGALTPGVSSALTGTSVPVTATSVNVLA
jgi:flagellar hook-length control protein FliK